MFEGDPARPPKRRTAAKVLITYAFMPLFIPQFLTHLTAISEVANRPAYCPHCRAPAVKATSEQGRRILEEKERAVRRIREKIALRRQRRARWDKRWQQLLLFFSPAARRRAREEAEAARREAAMREAAEREAAAKAEAERAAAEARKTAKREARAAKISAIQAEITGFPQQLLRGLWRSKPPPEQP